MSDKLSTKEAAEYCGIPIRTWERNYQVWEVPHFRVGRRIYYLRHELDTWFETRRAA